MIRIYQANIQENVFHIPSSFQNSEVCNNNFIKRRRIPSAEYMVLCLHTL